MSRPTGRPGTDPPYPGWRLSLAAVLAGTAAVLQLGEQTEQAERGWRQQIGDTSKIIK